MMDDRNSSQMRIESYLEEKSGLGKWAFVGGGGGLLVGLLNTHLGDYSHFTENEARIATMLLVFIGALIGYIYCEFRTKTLDDFIEKERDHALRSGGDG